MKILGAWGLRAQLDEAQRHTLAQEALDCFTIAALGQQELKDLLTRIPATSARG